MIYFHRQIGWVSLIILGLCILLLLGIRLRSAGDDSAVSLVVNIVTITIVIVAVIFSSQTIQVSEGTVTSRFGLGLFPKRLPIAKIVKAEVRRTRWYEGWGIHLTTRGWLYNVSGFQAVEFTLTDDSRISFGTDDPTNLVNSVYAAGEAARKQREAGEQK